MNGIFPITSHDHINYQSGVMMAEAMKYAVQTIDQEYLHGYKLEIQDIYDTIDDDAVKYIFHENNFTMFQKLISEVGRNRNSIIMGIRAIIPRQSAPGNSPRTISPEEKCP